MKVTDIFGVIKSTNKSGEIIWKEWKEAVFYN
jgi:hypothetical protein